MQIFVAVQKWCKYNSSSGAGIDAVVSLVRLPLMDLEQLIWVVLPSGIVQSDRLQNVIKEKTTSSGVQHRAHKVLCKYKALLK